MDWRADRDLLADAAREAGALALRYFKQNPETWAKGSTSVVSEADIALDRMLSERLRAARPDYGWRSEEDATPVVPGDVRPLFIVDPIDGTRDFLAGGSQWTVALAIVVSGRPVAGAVFAPARDALFVGAVGEGVTRNGVPVRAGARTEVSGSRIAAPRYFGRRALEGVGFTRKSVRVIPSLVYRFTLVATGELDAAISGPNAHDWDLAAADILVHEAGAVVTGIDGAPPRYGRADDLHPPLVAAAPGLAQEVCRLIAAAPDAEDPR